jgi:hypothetical protein
MKMKMTKTELFVLFAAAFTVNVASLIYSGTNLKFDSLFLGVVLGTFIFGAVCQYFFHNTIAFIAIGCMFFVSPALIQQKNTREQTVGSEATLSKDRSALDQAEFISGVTSGCRTQQGFEPIVNQWGVEKGSKLIEFYCKCQAEALAMRADFSKPHLVADQLKQIPKSELTRIDQQCTDQAKQIFAE